MSKKTTQILWITTTIIALILIGFTVNLASKANAQGGEAGRNISAYLTSDQPLIIILDEPNPRGFVAAIESRGTPITVTENLRRSGDDWFKITINEEEAGWVQGTYVSLEKP